MRDEQFIRGKLPMTKGEVRAVSLSKLELTPGAVFWDVGAGTGSVAVEAAWIFQQIDGQKKKSRVYAVERTKEGIGLIEKNRKKLVPEFADFFLVEGEAPEAVRELPAPSHVFIGGSRGRVKEIVQAAREKNPQVRIVVNAVTMETCMACMELIQNLPFREYEIVQVAVSRVEAVGGYHMQKAQNPVYVILLQG